MGQLFETIRELVKKEQYLVGQHASERLEERGILEWQVIAGMVECELITERSQAKPNPVVEVLITLPDGTEIKTVWSYLKVSQAAKLVTVHYFD